MISGKQEYSNLLSIWHANKGQPGATTGIIRARNHLRDHKETRSHHRDHKETRRHQRDHRSTQEPQQESLGQPGAAKGIIEAARSHHRDHRGSKEPPHVS
jgi:hypothetical protein